VETLFFCRVPGSFLHAGPDEQSHSPVWPNPGLIIGTAGLLPGYP
jgi:hypothetical protein